MNEMVLFAATGGKVFNFDNIFKALTNAQTSATAIGSGLALLIGVVVGVWALWGMFRLITSEQAKQKYSWPKALLALVFGGILTTFGFQGIQNAAAIAANTTVSGLNGETTGGFTNPLVWRVILGL